MQNRKKRKEEKEDKREYYPQNPYTYNLQGYFTKYLLGPSHLKSEKEALTPDEIKEKLNELETIYKACVHTIGEGNDATR